MRYWFGLAIFFFLLTFDFVLYSLDPFPVAWKVSSFKPWQQHDFLCATQQPEECIPTFMRKLRALERLDPQRLERWKPLPECFFCPNCPSWTFWIPPWSLIRNLSQWWYPKRKTPGETIGSKSWKSHGFHGFSPQGPGAYNQMGQEITHVGFWAPSWAELYWYKMSWIFFSSNKRQIWKQIPGPQFPCQKVYLCWTSSVSVYYLCQCIIQ